MNQQTSQVSAAGHRIAAVAVSDIVGYSRHLARDEDGTLARLGALRRDIGGPAVERFNGRLVKTLGDGVIAEFPGAKEALGCAVLVLGRLAADNARLPEDERIECRIGLHVGEIIGIGGDIFGTTVNIAARLEALAAPGSICLSAAIRDQTIDDIAGVATDLGLVSLKNIATPVHAYMLRPETVSLAGGEESGMATGEWRRPSLTVLPFEILNGAPDDAYFGDGIAEDLIAALSRCRWFFVVSRNSSFSLVNIRDDARRIATRLGVRYVLDGTVRRSGDHLRVVARLIDGRDGTQVWTGRYDRTAGDIFAIQDDIVEAIAATVEPEMELHELYHSRRKRPENLEAQDCFYRAHWHFHHMTADDNEAARSWYQQAIDREPSFARAVAGLAYTHYNDAVFGYTTDAPAAVAQGVELARRAVSLDPNDAFAHHVLGRLYMLLGRHEASIAELRHAIDLNPNNALAHYGLGFSLVMNGQPEQALPLLERAQRLSPHDPLLWAFLTVAALAHQIIGEYAEAEFAARRAVDSPNAGFWAWLQLAVAFAYRDKRAEAAAALAEARKARPDFSIAMLDRIFAFRLSEHRRIYVDGLLIAGIAEECAA